MKTANLKRNLICGCAGGALFAIAYALVGGFRLETSFASEIGYGIFFAGCWAIAEVAVGGWLRFSKAKKQEGIDAYTVALVEMELEREKKEPIPAHLGKNELGSR